MIERHLLGKPLDNVGWQLIWRTVATVTPEEWAASQQTYQRVLGLLKGFTAWEGENDIAGGLAILVHTAYHPGEIRQALCAQQPAHTDPMP